MKSSLDQRPLGHKQQITSFIQPVKKDSPAGQHIRVTMNVINILYSPLSIPGLLLDSHARNHAAPEIMLDFSHFGHQISRSDYPFVGVSAGQDQFHIMRL